MRADTLSFYEDNAASLCAKYDVAGMDWLYDKVCQVIPQGGSILDVGCGSGRDARRLSQLGYEVTACDASSQMLHHAKMTSDDGHINYLLRQFPLSNDDNLLTLKFDGIISIAMLMHLSRNECVQIVRQVSNMLSGGGFFIASWCSNRSEDPRNLREMSSGEFVSDILGSGLTVEGVTANKDSFGRAIVWHTVFSRKGGG